MLRLNVIIPNDSFNLALQKVGDFSSSTWGSSGFAEQQNWEKFVAEYGILAIFDGTTEFLIPAGGEFSRKWYNEYGIFISFKDLENSSPVTL